MNTVNEPKPGQLIQPSNNLQSVTARMTSPLNPSIGGMIAHFTCAT